MTEAFKDLHIHLLGSESDCLPFVLQSNHFLCLVFPSRECFQFIILDCFYNFANDSFLIQIVLFRFFQRFEMLLVTAVYSRRSSLETVPDFVTQFFSYRTCITKFLMQLLKLVESGNYIFFVSKLFGCFAKMSLDLQILFEVIFTKFVVQFQQIVEFLYVQLVILPKFIHLALRNQFGFVPLLLQLFELCIRFIGIITRFYQFFKFFDNGKLDLQIFFFLTFLFGYKLTSFLFDRSHEAFEFLFCRIILRSEVFGSASVVDKLLFSSF